MTLLAYAVKIVGKGLIVEVDSQEEEIMNKILELDYVLLILPVIPIVIWWVFAIVNPNETKEEEEVVAENEDQKKFRDIETEREMFNSIQNPSVSSWNATFSAIPIMRTIKSNKDFLGNAVFRGVSSLGYFGYYSAHEEQWLTWNEMIHGYAENEYVEQAISLYKDIIASGVKHDGVTFVAILTPCSHSGLVELVIVMMQKCLMPYKDDLVVWGDLVSSCQVHSNVRLAKKAA
ncbi:pentatricopeptide repeat-containing protein At2g13600-like [Citrus sinensis]|uniref:pentatricopeptide repeat-containing protein At2g13600-like n=1 Tax=Citrus sinensis TaxID=2711 RepID=UPI0022788F62|nr:pentatricopeptide repeat-containing protein At2g13600-like [Citrus sinensis]